MTRSSSRFTSRRRGSVLALTLVVVLSAGLIAGVMLVTATDAAQSGRAEADRAQMRALAWSGVLAAMADLERQRDAILQGQDPAFSPALSVPLTDSADASDTSAPRALVRLVPWPAGAGSSGAGASALPENARLPVNVLPRESFIAFGFGAAEVDAFLRQRDRRAFDSERHALRLLGEPRAAPAQDAAPATTSGVRSSSSTAPGSALTLRGTDTSNADNPDTPAAADLLTALSFDPELRALGESAGQPRVPAAQGLSKEALAALTQGLGPQATNALERAVELGVQGQFASRADAARAFTQALADLYSWDPNRPEGLPPADVPALGRLLDALAFAPSDSAPPASGGASGAASGADPAPTEGRVDLWRAPARVLAALPGFDDASAAAVVASRDAVELEARADLSWLVTQGHLTPAQFAQACDWLTTRSTQWRVRVEAGLVPPRADGSSADAGDPETLLRPIILEAVIDLSVRPARVAYLRDVTLLDAMLLLAPPTESTTTLDPDAALEPQADLALDDLDLDSRLNLNTGLGTDSGLETNTRPDSASPRAARPPAPGNARDAGQRRGRWGASTPPRSSSGGSSSGGTTEGPTP